MNESTILSTFILQGFCKVMNEHVVTVGSHIYTIAAHK